MHPSSRQRRNNDIADPLATGGQRSRRLLSGAMSPERIPDPDNYKSKHQQDRDG